MGLFNKKKDEVYWRDSVTNKIRCLGDDCVVAKKGDDCPDDCPIWANTMAQTLFRINQNDAALKELKRAVENAPDFKDAWVNMGACYGMMKNYVESINAYTKAYELDENYKNAIYGLALSNKDACRYAESLKWCEIYNRKFRDNALFGVENFCKGKI